MTRSLPGRILPKLDDLNPGFSKKDRAALGIIEGAERSRALRAGQHVVELTSGNMGTGLVIICAVKGHPFVAVMSCGNSQERAQMMRALGAEVVLVNQALGSPKARVRGRSKIPGRARSADNARAGCYPGGSVCPRRQLACSRGDNSSGDPAAGRSDRCVLRFCGIGRYLLRVR